MKNPKPFLEFAWRIELTLGVMQTFSVDHPRVAEPLAGALGAFRDLVSGKLEIQIVAAPGRLFINDEPLDVSTDINLAHLHDQMTERGVAGVVFGRDLNLEELRALLGLLAMHPHKALAQGGASGILGRARVRHIKLAEVRYEPVKAGESVGPQGQAPRRTQGLPMKVAQYDVVRQKIQDMGLSVERLDEYLGLMTWDHLDQAERLKLLMDGDRIFEVPTDFVLGFMKDLLEGRKPEIVSKVMAQLGKGLFAESGHRRLRVSEQFVGVAELTQAPGLTPPLEMELAHLLRNHFAQERDPKIHQLTCDGLVVLMAHWLESGDLEHVNGLVKDLGGSPLLWVPGTKTWKSESLQGVLEALSRRDRLVHLLPALYESKREELLKRVFPLITRMGESAARTLVHFLDGETTQSQRRRLIEALRAIGAPAIPPLRKALESPRWHLVRNAINTLRDLGGLPTIEDINRCLYHTDARVRAASARALRDLGGADLLMEALPKVAPDTQVEVALGLGHLHHLPALPALSELATGRGTIPHRVEAIKAIGMMGALQGISLLGGLIKAKGLRLGSEPLEIRMAAARALRAIGSFEAMEILEHTARESRGEFQVSLRQILDAD